MQDENRDDSKNESQEGKLGATEPHPERRTLNRTQLTFVSIAVLLCLALIGGSAWSLVSGGGLPVGAEAQGEGSSVQTSDSSTASKEPELDEADASEDASDAVDEPVAGDDASGGASSGLKSDASNKDKTGSNAGRRRLGFFERRVGCIGLIGRSRLYKLRAPYRHRDHFRGWNRWGRKRGRSRNADVRRGGDGV